MRHISSHIVGDNLKGEIAPFSFPLLSGGEEIKGAPLVYIPHLVEKVVQLLDGNERCNSVLLSFKLHYSLLQGWQTYLA